MKSPNFILDKLSKVAKQQGMLHVLINEIKQLKKPDKGEGQENRWLGRADRGP